MSRLAPRNLIRLVELNKSLLGPVNIKIDVDKIEKSEVTSLYKTDTEYSNLEDIEKASTIVNINSHQIIDIPFDFNANHKQQIVIDSKLDHMDVHKNTNLGKIITISTATALISGAVFTMSEILKKIPRFGVRWHSDKAIVSLGNSQIQKTTINIEGILSEYRRHLYTTIASSYALLSASNDNIQLRDKITDLQQKLDKSIAENKLLSSVIQQIKAAGPDIDRLSMNLLNADRHIGRLINENKRLEVRVKEGIEYYDASNRINESRMNHLKTWNAELDSKLNSYRSQRDFMLDKLKKYSEMIRLMHDRMQERDGIEIDDVEQEIKHQYGFENMGNIFNNKPGDAPFSNFGNGWFSNTVAGGVGALLSAIGIQPYILQTNNQKLSLEQRLEFALTSLDIERNNRDGMSQYVSELQKRASFEKMTSIYRQSHLLSKITDYDEKMKIKENENLSLKRQLEINEEELKLKKKEAMDYKKISNSIHARLLSSKLYSKSLKNRLNDIERDIEDVKALEILKTDYKSVKDFMKMYKLIRIPSQYTPITDALTSFRNEGYGVLRDPLNKKEVLGYKNFKLLEMLTRNGSDDNVYAIINNDNYDDFISNADFSGNMLSSSILKPRKLNQLANIPDSHVKTGYFLESLDGFFRNEIGVIAVAAGLTVVFLISNGPSGILNLITAMSTYIGRIILREVKTAIVAEIKVMIVDALIWALKMLFKEGKHLTNKIYRYISDIINGNNPTKIDDIDVTDPMIKRATEYIDNYMRNGSVLEDPGVQLPFDTSYLSKQAEDASDDGVAQAAGRFFTASSMLIAR